MDTLPPLPIPRDPEPVHREQPAGDLRFALDPVAGGPLPAPEGRRGALPGVRVQAHRLRCPGSGRPGPGGAGGAVALSPGDLLLGNPRRGRRGAGEPVRGHPPGTAGGGRAHRRRVGAPGLRPQQQLQHRRGDLPVPGHGAGGGAGRPRAGPGRGAGGAPGTLRPVPDPRARRRDHRRAHSGGPAGPPGPPQRRCGSPGRGPGGAVLPGPGPHPGRGRARWSKLESS